MGNTVNSVVKKYNGDETRLMDVLIDVQSELGYLSDWTIEQISKALDVSKVDVEQTVSFYHFFSKEPRGKFSIYLNNSAVAGFNGRDEVAKAFEEAAGTKFGTVSKDDLVGLFDTSCIGMNDQEPAAIINEKVFTKLTPETAKALIKGIKDGKTLKELAGAKFGDGSNEGMQSMVQNNIIKKGEVVFSDYKVGVSLEKLKSLSSDEVIKIVKDSNTRGRGGAGFPTGMKWEFAKKADGDRKYIFCNADEGEPGTFKDRVILTERPEMIFEGMVIAGYAVGAKEGILYLRNEYRYMRESLENTLEKMRKDSMLGALIMGMPGFNFDIRIQFGAGAYVCGEESALIESAEGKRGEPRDRPPFPVERGYLQMPTVVNNVETLCSVVKIIEKGADWYTKLGTEESKGTKVLSISGDCEKPGIYELEWGFSVKDIIKMVGAKDVQAVQVAGPSGSCIGPDEFDRKLCYTDLATGGSLIIVGKKRNLLKDVVLNFSEFFAEESCGSCVPCRALTVMYKNTLEKVIEGKGTKTDLENMQKWVPIMKNNRCGLGQTAMNPIITTMKNFKPLYDELVKGHDDKYVMTYNEDQAVADFDVAVGNK